MKKKEKAKNKKSIIVSLCMFLISAVYTLLVKFVDVRAIGPKGSSVGFSGINNAISKFLGFDIPLYKFSEFLGYIAIFIVLMYGLYGFVTLIKRKSLFKVDREILLLGVFYVIMLGVYIFFEKFIVNYRPVLIDNVLEASYPSSHTVLALCICGSAFMVNNRLFNNKKVFESVNMFLIVLMVMLVLTRFISGVHWFTDIIGGILISVTLLNCFKTLLDYKKI